MKGKEKPWTIGNYLLLTKKTASGLKIGVGCVDIEDLTDEQDPFDKVSCIVS